MRRGGFLAAALFAACAGAALAQEALEVIALKHRTADEVLPVLRPLLEPGGALTGQYGQLVLRASPANVAQIRRALEAIDRPPRRLEISVRFEEFSQADRQAIEGRGRIGRERADLELTARGERAQRDERVDQRVQAMEGGRAFIASGQSRPLPQREVIRTPGGTVVRESTVMHETATGFRVIPRLAGERVQLDIVADGASSSVSARLGEWFELGGVATERSAQSSGLLGARRFSGSESRRIWVKVEELGGGPR